MSNQSLIADREIQFIAAASVRLAAILLVASLFASSVAAAELPWMNDLEKAKQVAADQHKDLLIIFTGTSWCSWCISFEQEILSTDEFAPAGDTLVLVRLDYPHTALRPREWPRLPQEPPAPQRTWAEQYQGVFCWPTIFLADAKGVPYATPDGGDTPTEFVKHLMELRRVHQLRDEAFANAAMSEGVSKAKHLIAGLTVLQAAFADTQYYRKVNPLLQFYGDSIDEVVRLDCANDLIDGDICPYKHRVALRRRIATNFDKMGRTEDALAACDKAIEDSKLYSPYLEYEVLLDKAEVCWRAKHYEDSLKACNAAINTLKPDDPRRQYGLRRVYILAKLGLAEDAWNAYDEFAKSKFATPQTRLNSMSSITSLLDQAGSTEAARDAAIKTKQAIASLKDPAVDPSQAQEIVDKVLTSDLNRDE